MLENFQRGNSEAAGWTFVDPPGAHASITAWYAQRIVRLWQQKRERETLRTPSPKSQAPAATERWNCGGGIIAHVPDRDALAETLRGILPEKPERVLVKVTWHGYATGTYTDPAALDLLLAALPAPAIILEGHTSSRNLGGAETKFNGDSCLPREVFHVESPFCGNRISQCWELPLENQLPDFGRIIVGKGLGGNGGRLNNYCKKLTSG